MLRMLKQILWKMLLPARGGVCGIQKETYFKMNGRNKDD